MAIAAASTPRLAAPSEREMMNVTTRPLIRSASRATARTELFLKTPRGSSIRVPRVVGASLTRASSPFLRLAARRAQGVAVAQHPRPGQGGHEPAGLRRQPGAPLVVLAQDE